MMQEEARACRVASRRRSPGVLDRGRCWTPATIVAVRIIGLVALLKGAMACTSIAVLPSGVLLGAGSPSRRVLAAQAFAIAVATLVPAIAGVICLKYSKPLAVLLTSGTEVSSAPPVAGDGVPPEG